MDEHKAYIVYFIIIILLVYQEKVSDVYEFFFDYINRENFGG